jgi:predicted metal-dependent peptidase
MLPQNVVADMPCKTACTDGTQVKWHPDYLLNTTKDEVRKTIVHETLHCTLGHTDGRYKQLVKQYGPETAGLAADHEVNNFMVEVGEQLDSSWVLDLKYRGWRMEDIAVDIHRDGGDGNTGGGGGGGDTAPDNHGDMESADADQVKEAADFIETVEAHSGVMDAFDKDNEGEKTQGSNNLGDLLKRARDNRHKAQDWRDELLSFAGSKPNERISTYAKLPRREGVGYIKAGKRKTAQPHIGVIVDTSGSMYHDLPKIMVELEFMSESGYTFDVVCCDGDVYGPYSFDRHEFDYRELPLEGGGGSNMEVAFEKIKEHCPDADALIFCTDGYIHWPSEKLLAELPPCILVTFDGRDSREEYSLFAKHIVASE